MSILDQTPSGQQLWAWTTEAGVTLLYAKDEDEAYSKCIQIRLGANSNPTPEEVENQQRWFAQEDRLDLVFDHYEGPAFAGELPEYDEDEDDDYE